MNELIEIIQKDGFNAVSARELHEKLGIETQYTKWFDRVREYGFEENKDFITVSQKRLTAQGNKTTYTDHFISLDMAKEICMIQRSEIGRKFRRYFIECEKKLLAPGNKPLIGYDLAYAELIAGSEAKVFECVAKCKLLEKHPSLSVSQVDTMLRLLPLYPTIQYVEIAKLAGVCKDTLLRCRRALERMRG